ncbi:MAG: hypothetical protein ACTSPI_03565 [Candidatus Heimdallarchaeaceae archaeon]
MIGIALILAVGMIVGGVVFIGVDIITVFPLVISSMIIIGLVIHKIINKGG